ncbi:MAG: helix-turn-helix domain-containing protein [Verrucomicrobia bacterium]|nr:helix-turn-helix domain-containing protein [Verrucomicrobiota bacterium]
MPAAPDRFLTFGLASRHVRAERRAVFHRHNEVELLFVDRGAITHLFDARRVTFSAGELAVFWGAVPHLPVAFRPGTQLDWLTVPLAWVLQWQLPATFTAALLQGRIVRGVGGPGAAADRALFARWHADLRSGRADRHHLVLLECEARLRRLLLDGRAAAGAGGAPDFLPPAAAGKVEAMAAHVARHYAEPLSVDDIARAVGLHPDYAGAVFRRTFGLTLLDYLTALRVSHAQRLLMTTNEKILHIAFAAGFGSASRFYAVFTRACGLTPRAYRRSRPTAPGRRR